MLHEVLQGEVNRHVAVHLHIGGAMPGVHETTFHLALVGDVDREFLAVEQDFVEAGAQIWLGGAALDAHRLRAAWIGIVGAAAQVAHVDPRGRKRQRTECGEWARAEIPRLLIAHSIRGGLQVFLEVLGVDAGPFLLIGIFHVLELEFERLDLVLALGKFLGENMLPSGLGLLVVAESGSAWCEAAVLVSQGLKRSWAVRTTQFFCLLFFVRPE